MQPINFTGPPSYFNRDGSPSLACRWAGYTASALSGKYSAVEIGPATLNPRPFYVVGFQSDTEGQSIYMYRTTGTKLTTVEGTLAANSSTEFGAVSTNSIIKYGDIGASGPAETDSDVTENAGGSTPLYKRFSPPLYIPAGSYFTLVEGSATSAFFVNFYFFEIVQP